LATRRLQEGERENLVEVRGPVYLCI
jgi:hypothetical protein